MLENTNALIGTIIAVLRELRRCQALLDEGSLDEDAEEEMGDFVNQLHEALADLSAVYNLRLTPDSKLLTIDELVVRIANEKLQFPKLVEEK